MVSVFTSGYVNTETILHFFSGKADLEGLYSFAEISWIFKVF